jgi:hypothetical protein
MPSSSVSNHQLVDGGKFTNIGAIGIITNALFFHVFVSKIINIAHFLNTF